MTQGNMSLLTLHKGKSALGILASSASSLHSYQVHAWLFRSILHPFNNVFHLNLSTFWRRWCFPLHLRESTQSTMLGESGAWLWKILQREGNADTTQQVRTLILIFTGPNLVLPYWSLSRRATGCTRIWQTTSTVWMKTDDHWVSEQSTFSQSNKWRWQ